MELPETYNTPFFANLEESQQVELKTSFSDEVIVSLVAFANAKGGSVYIGISDLHQIRGVEIGKENLMTNNYRSTPRNKLLADFFKDVGLIEKYGSGIQRIVSAFKTAGMPFPQFTNISNGFMVTVFSENLDDVTDNVTDNVTDDVTDKREKTMMEMMERNGRVAVSELATRLNVTRRTILRDIGKLKDRGIIKRVGSGKSGYWKIVKA